MRETTDQASGTSHGATPAARRWIGRYLVGVGVLHCLVGLVLYAPAGAAIVRDGLWNAVDPHADRNVFFWFLCAGALLILVALLVDRAEHAHLDVPRSVLWGWTTLTIVCLIAMPISGFWLVLPALVGLARHNARCRAPSTVASSRQ
ncbi:MAG: DUF6463 family protein [Gemmatimonadaceae bacterium]|jgi:hypothetical protein|nr:DUF6463 family protein [Gemmatimonadaceae bacterium]